MHGGYFGVSVFFTLSGFLITSLLVHEYDATTRISPGAFYMRRAKRLLPASTVCLAVVSIMATGDVWRGADHLRRDALGALFQVANWVQLGGGGSYTDLQSKSAGLLSPFEHYWSLAIEEQFYWLWPLAFWGVARLASRRRWSLTRIMTLMTVVVAAVAPLIAVIWGRDAAYWATPGRAGEILIGALLAVALREDKIAAQRWMAPVFLMAVVVIAMVLPAVGGPAYHGAFPLLALASGGLLLGLQRSGPVTSALSWRPFVGLGAISYGVYLFHFPVYVLMSADRIGRSGWQLLVARVVVTLAIALASYWLIERPIRRATFTGARTGDERGVGRWCGHGRRLVRADRNATYWTASASAVAAAEIRDRRDRVVTLRSGDETFVDDHRPDRPPSAPLRRRRPRRERTSPSNNRVDTAADDGERDPADTAASGAEPTSANHRPRRLDGSGDGLGTGGGAALNPTVAKVTVMAAPGCGFITAGAPIPISIRMTGPTATACSIIDLPEALHRLAPDVIMMMTTIPDIAPRVFDRRSDPSPRWTSTSSTGAGRLPGRHELDPDNSSAHIVWIKPPLINPYWMDIDSETRDPVVHSVMEGVMGELVTAYPDRVALLDMRTWLEEQGLDQRPFDSP